MKICRRQIVPVILILVFLFPGPGWAQVGKTGKPGETRSRKEIRLEKMEEHKIARWDFGINFGGFFANRYTADYYNGADDHVNSIGYVMKNKYWYEEIKKYLNAADTILVEGLPQNMHYGAALSGGLFFRYNFSTRWGMFFQFDYAQLKTDGVFTVNIDPATYLTNPDIRLFGIHGRERRMNFDLGAHCRFPVYKQKMNLFLQGGLNVNYAKVLKAYINFDDREYSIINIYGSQNYIPNSNLQENEIIQGGFGYGPFASGGAGFIFSKQIGMELGGYLKYIRVNLEGYNEFRPSGGVYIRLVLNNLLSREEE